MAESVELTGDFNSLVLSESAFPGRVALVFEESGETFVITCPDRIKAQALAQYMPGTLLSAYPIRSAVPYLLKENEKA